MPVTESLNLEERIKGARRWIEIGNDRRGRAGATLQESLDAYDKAIELVSSFCESETSPVRDDLASAWINRGIALMHDGGSPSLRQSVECFDRAIGLRTTLLGLGDPWFRYNLIGVWINRGDALARFGDEASRAAALASYEEAIRLGSGMESDRRPKVAWRMALAHLNRGATLLQLGGAETLAEAGRSFDSSIAALGASEDSQRLIAAYAWEGKAEVMGRQGSEAEARTCARRAMALVSGLEPGGLDATIVGLKARIALCASSWRALSKAGGSTMDRNESAEALDAADEGLRIAFGWPATRQMESLIVELFRFGSLGYASLQPQFLGEFIGDFVKPSASAELGSALRPIAIQAVRNAIGKLAGDGLMKAGLDEPEIAMFAQLRSTLESLERR